MTGGRQDDRSGRGRGAPRRTGGPLPRRDLGPAAPTDSSFEWASPLTAWSVADEFTVEALEIAALRAEMAVQPFLTARRAPRFSGVSTVELRFSDARTLASFRRTRSIRSTGTDGVWRLVRRWAHARGDGGLDEAMCSAAATYLNADFAGLLQASVVTWVIRSK